MLQANESELENAYTDRNITTIYKDMNLLKLFLRIALILVL